MKRFHPSFALLAVFAALTATACGGVVVPPSAPAATSCVSLVPTRGGAEKLGATPEAVRGASNGQAFATMLVDEGAAIRDRALRAQFSPGVEWPLEQAAQCFERALTFAPDQYDAVLGAGITYLALARAILRNNTSRSEQYLLIAKTQLGRAYFLRHGSREALYYLAEAALLEENSRDALVFLAPLQRSGYRPGPVSAMLGDAAYLAKDTEAAKTLWRAAARSGYPAETVEYANFRLRGRR